MLFRFHLLATGLYLGTTAGLALFTVPQARRTADGTARRAALARSLRIYDPLAIALLGVMVMTGAWSITELKQTLGTNYFVDPTGVVQREDQVYDVADESATSAACGCNTGAIIEVDLVTGKQTVMAGGAPFVNPTALVVEPATDDLLVLDRSAGTDARGDVVG